VNQLGQVQAIGGVNEKIEGFYAVCKSRGFTGEQGVMIPKDNLRNLMLKPEVVAAVKAGKFHIWAVSSIDQGIELLTGIPAGKLRKDDSYPPGTIYRKVTDALEAMTRRAVEVNRAAQRELVGAVTNSAKRGDSVHAGDGLPDADGLPDGASPGGVNGGGPARAPAAKRNAKRHTSRRAARKRAARKPPAARKKR
jgi:hypothetical protein